MSSLHISLDIPAANRRSLISSKVRRSRSSIEEPLNAEPETFDVPVFPVGVGAKLVWAFAAAEIAAVIIKRRQNFFIKTSLRQPDDPDSGFSALRPHEISCSCLFG